MNGTTAELNAGKPGRAEVVEARNWIARQLRWEQTLGTLRNHRAERSTQRAA